MTGYFAPLWFTGLETYFCVGLVLAMILVVYVAVKS